MPPKLPLCPACNRNGLYKLSYKVQCCYCTWRIIIFEQTLDELLLQIEQVRQDVQEWQREFD